MTDESIPYLLATSGSHSTSPACVSSPLLGSPLLLVVLSIRYSIKVLGDSIGRTTR